MLFMIDTCQANTMYSRLYTPNIIATGSSEIDQSSYSHHADNDVGVAVIDRWTYYILDFLESQVTSPASKLTLGNLFDSYDETKIHSRPGVRWDLFPGSEKGRERLVMDFFGNVQGVEIERAGGNNGSELAEDLTRLSEIMRRRKEGAGSSDGTREPAPSVEATSANQNPGAEKRLGAAKVEFTNSWFQQMMGASALLGCAMIWGGASWFESST